MIIGVRTGGTLLAWGLGIRISADSEKLPRRLWEVQGKNFLLLSPPKFVNHCSKTLNSSFLRVRLTEFGSLR